MLTTASQDTDFDSRWTTLAPWPQLALNDPDPTLPPLSLDETLFAASRSATGVVTQGTTAEDKGLWLTGARIDQFCIQELIGRGGMGEVYLAQDTLLCRPVALKVLRGSDWEQTVDPQSFLNEIRTLGTLSHRNIVTLYSAGDVGGVPYMALEHIAGPTLREAMQRGLSSSDMLSLGLTLAQTIEYLHHRGLAHYDIKPDNIVLGQQLKLIDFGLARKIRRDRAQAGVTLHNWPPAGEAFEPEDTRRWETFPSGTPHYMAPEQWRGEAPSSAVDVWAFGAILYEHLTGQPPICEKRLYRQANKLCSAEPVPAIAGAPGLPAELAALAMRCLQKDPRCRASIQDVVGTLQQLVAGVGATARTTVNTGWVDRTALAA